MNGTTLKKSQGVGLIEVLITMLILSTTLITLAALQTRSLQYNHGTYLGSQANILAADILDRIRANKRSPAHAVQIASYNTTAAVFTASSVPTSSRAAADIYIWRQNIESYMPGGTGGISCSNSTMLCTITITWNEVNNINSLSSRDTLVSFSYTTRL
ncbi:pilus assembly protein PilV [Cellvibrio zantedeschiae]|uniref:Pilus assembly protein PilV n=1 Tax=Cellvibrio zantedeschiae TaxID=1237077 RepID=A0ABQ3B624_9GAMM|nr:type IV pilus modification protein PilV [Cellvibrio zantedeschiae]GGY80594.1 pilus assembly protein PilV [Cellvibrio zantedeschiae]